MGSGGTLVRGVGGGGGERAAPSALPAPGRPVFTTARPQQRLQSHLHERLEVTASLPSAVLRKRDETKDR